MINITRRDRWRNTKLRNATKVEDIIEKVKKAKWIWAGYTTKRQDNRWTKRSTDWTPRYGTRQSEEDHKPIGRMTSAPSRIQTHGEEKAKTGKIGVDRQRPSSCSGLIMGCE